MKKIIGYITCLQLLLLSGLKAEAQQESMYSQYMFNTLAINPAYAGNKDMIHVTTLFRAQWVGIEGAPASQNLSIDAPLPNRNVGLGLVLMNDKVGATRNTGIQASYAYHLKFNDFVLSMGLNVGIKQYNIQLGNAEAGQGIAPDDKVFEYNGSTYIPSTGAGVYIKGENYYAGVSIPSVFNTSFGNKARISVDTKNHLYVTAGYAYQINDNFTLKPSLLYKAVIGSPMQLDANCSVWMYDVIGVGAGYRTSDAIIGMLELKPTPNLRIGYSFDYTTSSIISRSSGSHELMLRYQFKFPESWSN